MVQFALALTRMRPRLETYAEKTDRQIDAAATRAGGETRAVVARVMRLVDRKRRLVDLALIWSRMTAALTEKEKRVLCERCGSRTEESIAEELGVCRGTVRNYYNRALDKCVFALSSVKKTGFDLGEYDDILGLPVGKEFTAEPRLLRSVRRKRCYPVGRN